mmetsp:Transcript_107784/g.332999  ORF Transcript_107784/g.332999 Transcript_107784/m.332999 type:complete len:398 (+) Transcript_107784:53-1246(+)
MEEAEDIELLEQDLYVQVHVEAEDEDDQCYRWSCRVPCCKPLLPMRAQWAEAHGVVEAAVGFEDYLEREVDLQLTPAELGWSSKAPVHLHAVPVDNRFAEGAEGDIPTEAAPPAAKKEPLEATVAAVAAPPASALRARLAQKQTTAAAPAAALPAPAALPAAAPPAPAPAPAAPASAAPAPAPAPVPAVASPAPAPPAPATAPRAEAPIATALKRARDTQDLTEQESESPTSMKFAPLTSCTTTIDLDDELEESTGSGETGASGSSSSFSTSTSRSYSSGSSGASVTPATPAAPAATATAANAAAPLRKRSRGADGDSVASGAGLALKDRGKSDDGACPQSGESVTFDVRNPKKAGTASHDRYEKYKAAKTPGEALRLGASKGDLLHDFKRGFMKRC